jgi:hypothetical protein
MLPRIQEITCQKRLIYSCLINKRLICKKLIIQEYFCDPRCRYSEKIVVISRIRQLGPNGAGKTLIYFSEDFI